MTSSTQSLTKILKGMKKITITKGIQMGATIGAFMYAYYIAFEEGGYSYSFTATEEGIDHAARIWKEAGYEIVWMKIVNGQRVAA